MSAALKQDTEILLSRQPIFDLRERVFAYDISLRGSDALGADEGLILEHVVAGTLDTLTGGRRAWVPASVTALERGVTEVLDADTVILHLTGPWRVTPAVEAAVHAAAAAGYLMAVDLEALAAGARALLPALRFVAVDADADWGGKLEELVRSLRARDVRLLARNVTSKCQFEACVARGFEFFEGVRFKRPEAQASKELSVDQLRTMELLRLLQDMDVPDTPIVEALRSDVGLSYRLLRIVNSAAVGGRGIESIDHAVRLMGRQPLYKWLLLLLLSTGRHDGVQAEIIHTALLRGRLCELLAPVAGRAAEADALYTVGLFSLLDILLGAPLEQLMAQMHLSEEARSALLDRSGFLGGVLRLVEGYDLGMWDECAAQADAVSIPLSAVSSLYLTAVDWATDHLASIAAA